MNKKALLRGGLLLAFLLLACISALADILTYEWTGNGYKRKSRETAPGEHMAWVCKNGTCVDYCGVCHTQQPQMAKYTIREQQEHFNAYHAKSEVRFQQGQQIDFSGLKLSRERDRLVAMDGKGGKHVLPVGARLLQDRNGNPQGIVYRGAATPW